MSVRQTARSALAEPHPRAWRWYLAGCLVVAAAYSILSAGSPHLHGLPRTLLYDSVGVASSVAILLGVRWYRPSRPLPWYLVAIALSMTAAGDITTRFLSDSPVAVLRNLPGLLYLVAFPLGGAGVLLVLHRRSPGRDRAGLMDALIVATGLGLLAWTFLVVGFARQTGMPLADKLNYLGAPLLGVVVVALTVRLAGGDPPTTSFRLLVAGIVALLASNSLLAVYLVTGVQAHPDPAGFIYLFGFACVGAAALHPSIRTLQERALPAPARLTRGHVSLLLGIALVTPTLLAVQAVAGRPVGLPTLLVGTAVLFALVLARMAGLAAEETARADLREQVLDRIVAATEEERTRVAADLHDGPLQRLAAIFYSTALVQSRLERGDLERGRELVKSLEDKVGEEIDAIRRLMVDLRPPVLDEAGLGPALVQAGAELARRTGTRCTVDAAPGLRLDSSRETVLYRVAQEALTNVTKHARARTVEITVAVDGGTARLEVADDGVGFDPAGVQGLDGRHFGLTLMRQRVAMAGGTLDIQARPGHGTALVAHLPLSPSASPPKALDPGGRWGSRVPPHG
jgi:signal transduction histidine kinase